MENNLQKWELDSSFASRSRFKKFNKQHPEEYASCFANLNKIKGILESGHCVNNFKVGFFRAEGSGLYRIGQTGIPSAKESRLYISIDEAERKIYILGIGTKETQQKDIIDAKKQIQKMKSNER